MLDAPEEKAFGKHCENTGNPYFTLFSPMFLTNQREIAPFEP